MYNSATDFIALWRNTGGNVSKLEMPGLDFTIAALARAGVITLAVSATAPAVNQAKTAWLQAAVPSTSGEGTLFLWDPVASAYAAASPALFLDMLQACAGESGISWWTSTGGAPLNTVGNNGDFAIRIDQPGGVYGPKASGAWPVNPLPGTTTGFASTELDEAFGAQTGNMLYRAAAQWGALAIGAANSLLVSNGSGPVWEALSTLMDAVFGSAQGSVLYRDAAVWNDLPPGTATGLFLQTEGANANPAWAPAFPAGTVMLFGQTAAPLGWTKLTTANDAALRVVSGATGSSLTGSGFSVVFAQTQVGNTALDITQIPSHTHTSSLDGKTPIKTGASGSGITAAGVSQQALSDGPFSINAAGGSGGTTLPHTHSINMNLNYVDVIMAQRN